LRGAGAAPSGGRRNRADECVWLRFFAAAVLIDSPPSPADRPL